MPLRPLNQFFCGCSVTFGVKLILYCNLLANLFYILIAYSNIVLRHPTFGFNVALSTQIFNAAFSLFGLPFIFGGILGAIYRLETHIRLYLYYLMISFAIDLLHFGMLLLVGDVCDQLPSAFKQSGEAFACGFARISSIVFLVFLSVIETYCIYTVWSFAQDLKAGGCGGKLPDLLASAGDLKKARMRTKDYSESLYPINSGSGKMFGYGAGDKGPMLGGSSKFFNGHYHDTSFPPKMV